MTPHGPLLSDAYQAALREKQRVKPWRGTHGKYATEVATRVREGDVLLDFGCARQDFGRALSAVCPGFERVVGYDPAQPGLDEFPGGEFHIIVATDVLEHIEPEYLSTTLLLLESVCLREMFFVINTKATGQLLPDGGDHHRIVQPKAWWLETLSTILPAWGVEVVFEVEKDFGCWAARA